MIYKSWFITMLPLFYGNSVEINEITQSLNRSNLVKQNCLETTNINKSLSSLFPQLLSDTSNASSLMDIMDMDCNSPLLQPPAMKKNLDIQRLLRGRQRHQGSRETCNLWIFQILHFTSSTEVQQHYNGPVIVKMWFTKSPILWEDFLIILWMVQREKEWLWALWQM